MADLVHKNYRVALVWSVNVIALGGSVSLARAAEPSAGMQDIIAEVTVTARKREERLIEVPQSITAVTADDLARLNATQLRDFADTVPAVTVSSAGVGQNQVSIRGVTTGVNVGPTTGIYVDDVPYGGSTAYSTAAGLALDVGLFDLERIEVLRGPQGTLYGASSMGGVLRYVLRQPNLAQLGVTAQAGLSFTEEGSPSYNAALSLDAPLMTDKLGLRVSAFHSTDGGVIDNVALGQKDIDSRVDGGRVDLLFAPVGSALSVRLTGFAQDIHRDGSPRADFTLAGQPVHGELEQRRLLREPFDQKFRLLSGTITYDFGGAALTSVSSYQTSEAQFPQDGSALYVPTFSLYAALFPSLGLPAAFDAVGIDAASSTDKFTQEVRLTSPTGALFEWLVGGFYTKEHSGNTQVVVPYLSGAVYPFNFANASLPSEYEESAGFANLTIRLSDRFDVTGGVRYARNDQTYTQSGTGLLINPLPAAHSSENVTTYLANARFRFNDRTMAYARFSTGYRPGGPNAVIVDPASGRPLAPPTFESDTLKSYEIGFKAETANRALGVDVAAYHIDWDNIQAPSVVNGSSVIANADSATIDGAELTLTARVTSRFTVNGAFAYQDAQLAEDSPALGGLKGDPLPNVPKFTASLNADYLVSNNSWQPTVGATLRSVSDRKSSFDASALPQYDLGDYATFDLRAGATFGSTQAQLFARNIFDERGQLSAATSFAAAGGPAWVTLLQPRTIGISISSTF